MKSVLNLLNERVKPVLFTVLFVIAQFLISIFIERRHIYF